MAGRMILLGIVTLAFTGWIAACSDSGSAPTAIDTAPPAVPTDLGYDFQGGAVALTWAPNATDADFAGFVVVRMTGDVQTDLVAVPQNITSFTDVDPQPGLNIYLVSAVDRSGNESAYASIQVVFTKSHRPGELDHQ